MTDDERDQAARRILARQGIYPLTDRQVVTALEQIGVSADRLRPMTVDQQFAAVATAMQIGRIDCTALGDNIQRWRPVDEMTPQGAWTKSDAS